MINTFFDYERKNEQSNRRKGHDNFITVAKDKLSVFCVYHICFLYLAGNNKKTVNVKKIHCKYLKDLGVNPIVKCAQPDVIINCSFFELTEAENFADYTNSTNDTI